MADQDIQKLNSAVRLLKSSYLIRIISRPWHFGYSKLLEILAGRIDKGIEKTAKVFWGDSMQVVFPERVSLSIYRYGHFEEGLTRIMLRYLRPGMVFFDVGAHFGYYSLLASHLVGSNGEVHAFEPTPSTYSMLKKNIGVRSNITAVNAAAYSNSTTLMFTDFGLTYSAYNSFYDGKMELEEKENLKPKSISVKAIMLDDYISKASVEPDFLKIDAEGAELEILKGMKSILETIRPILTLEVGDIGKDRDMPLSRNVIEFMLERGYSCLESNNGKLIKSDLRDQYEYMNLLFLPR